MDSIATPLQIVEDSTTGSIDYDALLRIVSAQDELSIERLPVFRPHERRREKLKSKALLVIDTDAPSPGKRRITSRSESTIASDDYKEIFSPRRMLQSLTSVAGKEFACLFRSRSPSTVLTKSDIATGNCCYY